MKHLLNILFCLFAFYSFSQVTGDIKKDTAQANRYFEEVLSNGMFHKKEASISLLEEAISLYEKHPFDEKVLEMKGRLARLFGAVGRYKEAEELAFLTIDLGEKEFPNKTIISALSPAYQALSESSENKNKGIEYAFKSRDCLRDNLPKYFAFSDKLHYSFILEKRYGLADSIIIELEEIVSSQSKEEAKRYSVYIYKCKLMKYFLLENFDKALIYGQKFFDENEKYNIYSLKELSIPYLRMGEIYSTIGKHDEAIKWTDKATEISGLSKEHAKIGAYYTYLANIYREKKEYPKAIEYYEKGIELLLKDTLSYLKTLGIDYFDLSNIYLELDDFDKAMKYLKQSQRFYPSPTFNYQLGNILYEQQKIEEAIVETHKALLGVCTDFKDKDFIKNPSIYEKYLVEQYADIFLHSKGYYLYDLGEQRKDIVLLESAIESAMLSLRLVERSWQRLKGFDNSRFFYNKNMTSTLTTVMIAQELIYELEPTEENFNKYFEATDRLKALQLVETLSPSPLPRSVSFDEQRIIESIKNAGQDLEIIKHQNNKDSISYYQERLFQASQVLEDHQRRIQKKYPKSANNFYNLKYANLQDIQQELDEGVLLISYNKGRRENLITTISASNNKIVKVKSTDFNANIRKLNELIQDHFAFQKAVREEFIDVSHELYKTLIQPIESELEGKTQLMIVVEGQLFNLPFELLLPTNEKKPYHELDFLIKKYEINYHYSATAMLRLMEKETVRDNSMLAFAPIFSKGEKFTSVTRSIDFMVDSLYQSIENFEFVALPNTKTEVNAIAKMIKSKNGQTNILLDKNATKTNLSEQLEKQSYQFIHIATHGLMNFKNPKLSALACYSKSKKMDNLIYANEIQFKDINADLVVLSSCESGIGQLVQGEGLIALNRSFIYSGAKNVLFSLWKVNDKYSSKLMIDFYKYYLEGQSYTTALRNAKLEMLANSTSAQPNFWAAFILMGR